VPVLPQILWGVLLPAVVAGLVLLLRGKRSPAAAVALAIGVGHAAGCVALLGWPPFPAVKYFDWIFWFALAAAVAAAIPLPSWARVTGDGAIATGFSLLLLLPIARLHWSFQLAAAAIAGASAAVMALWWSLERLSSTAGGRFGSVALWAAPTGMSIALVQATNARLGQQAGMLAATLGAAAVLAWIGERVRFGRGSLGPCAIVLGGLGLAGMLNGLGGGHGLSWVSALLIGVAPLAAFGARALAARRRLGTPAALAGIALEALLLAAAVGIEIARAPPPPDY
jgi:hypothetical protein